MLSDEKTTRNPIYAIQFVMWQSQKAFIFNLTPINDVNFSPEWRKQCGNMEIQLLPRHKLAHSAWKSFLRTRRTKCGIRQPHLPVALSLVFLCLSFQFRNLFCFVWGGAGVGGGKAGKLFCTLKRLPSILKWLAVKMINTFLVRLVIPGKVMPVVVVKSNETWQMRQGVCG